MHEFLLLIKIKGTVLLEGKYWFVCSPGTFEMVSVPAPFLLSSPATRRLIAGRKERERSKAFPGMRSNSGSIEVKFQASFELWPAGTVQALRGCAACDARLTAVHQRPSPGQQFTHKFTLDLSQNAKKNAGVQSLLTVCSAYSSQQNPCL